MALWAGAGMLVQLFVSLQLVLSFGLFALAAGLLACARQRFNLMGCLKLGSVGLGALLITGWYAWYPVQLHEKLGFGRSEQLVQALSARPLDYLSQPLTTSFPSLPKESIYTDTGGLFPGFALLWSAGWGAFVGLGRGGMRAWTLFFLGALGLAFILSLGLNSPVEGGAIFTALRAWAPGFHELRSPFRFAILAQVFLVLLSLKGLADLRRFRLPAANVMAVCLAGLIALTETLCLPQPMAPARASWKAPWVAWVAGQAERTVLGHIPFPDGIHVSDYQIEAERMLAQTKHHKPMINGYSGFFPPGYTGFQLDMAEAFPTPFLVCFLGKGLKVDTLVIDRAWHEAHEKQLAPYPELSQIVYQDEAVVIYALLQSDGDCVPER